MKKETNTRIQRWIEGRMDGKYLRIRFSFHTLATIVVLVIVVVVVLPLFTQTHLFVASQHTFMQMCERDTNTRLTFKCFFIGVLQGELFENDGKRNLLVDKRAWRTLSLDDRGGVGVLMEIKFNCIQRSMRDNDSEAYFTTFILDF